MKTYTLRVKDEQDEATVLALLTDLLQQQRIELEDNQLNWSGAPLTAEEFAGHLQAAINSPRLSSEEAQRYLGR